MDALVEAALRKVNESVKAIDEFVSATHKQERIAKAINAVNALKSALKAV